MQFDWDPNPNRPCTYVETYVNQRKDSFPSRRSEPLLVSVKIIVASSARGTMARSWYDLAVEKRLLSRSRKLKSSTLLSRALLAFRGPRRRSVRSRTADNEDWSPRTNLAEPHSPPVLDSSSRERRVCFIVRSHSLNPRRSVSSLPSEWRLIRQRTLP